LASLCVGIGFALVGAMVASLCARQGIGLLIASAQSAFNASRRPALRRRSHRAGESRTFPPEAAENLPRPKRHSGVVAMGSCPDAADFDEHRDDCPQRCTGVSCRSEPF
jgi:hypothetical protein